MELGIKRKRYQRLFSKLALGLLALVAVESQAATCGPYDASIVKNITIPVLGPSTITVAEDLAIGSKIYGQTYIIALDNWGWKCTWPASESPVTIQPVYSMKAVTTPGGAPMLSNATTVFPTNIPGIGFTITEHFTTLGANSIFPATGLGTPLVVSSGSAYSTGKGSGLLQMYLIKTGPIATNTGNQQIQASSFPHMETSIGVTSPDPYEHVIWNIRFTGVINIVTKTCQVDDVDVELGSHQLSDFPSVGSTSDWKEFNITLRNCPPYFGYPYSASSFIYDETGNLQGNNNLRANTMDMSFTSVHGNYSLSTANIESGPGAAEGFGIQMATGASSIVNIITDGRRVLQSALGVVLTKTDGANYVIPLKARYYRYGSASAIQPGKANGAVMFTVNYY